MDFAMETKYSGNKSIVKANGNLRLALVDLTPQKLVLATGDGSKGKGKGETSFPDCVIAALEHGWTVELFSWRHSLSAEWLKVSTKYSSAFRIVYLDQYLSKITYVDYRQRKRTNSEQNGPKPPLHRVKS